MLRTLRRHGPLSALLVLLAACGGLVRSCWAPSPLSPAEMDALHAAPDPAPADGPLAVYHLGHSLVGRDMPAMLEQLAPEGHRHHSQTGAGTSLREHWEPDVPIFMFEEANDHPRHRDPREALASGDYDAFVMTEMVEIRDAIKWHDSWDYAARWTRFAREEDPGIRVYLYETWHPLDDPEGWLARLDRDLGLYWEGEILARVQAADGIEAPVRVIPGGQVMAAVVRAIEGTKGGVGGLARREDLFRMRDDGTQDMIHFNDIGAYLMALTHYAVLYRRSPVGLPHELLRADGTPADAPGPEAARLMQETVWEVVTSYPKTGVPARGQ
jgi:hypothetical protein